MKDSGSLPTSLFLRISRVNQKQSGIMCWMREVRYWRSMEKESKFTRDGKYVIADTGSMLYDEDELPIGGNVLFDLEGNVKRSNDYESISYGGDNGWLCVHNKKTNQTVYLNSDLKTELDLGDAYGAAGDFKKCLRRQ